jgi:hypothetical protein
MLASATGAEPIAGTILVAYTLPTRVESYEDEFGRRPFDDWFNELSPDYAVKVQLALGRIEAGHTSGLKSVGDGVHEWGIDWGQGCGSTSRLTVDVWSFSLVAAPSADSKAT